MSKSLIIAFDRGITLENIPDCVGVLDYKGRPREAEATFQPLDDIDDMRTVLRDRVLKNILICLASTGGDEQTLSGLIEIIHGANRIFDTTAVVGSHAMSAAANLMVFASNPFKRFALDASRLLWHSPKLVNIWGEGTVDNSHGGRCWSAAIVNSIKDQALSMPGRNLDHPFIRRLDEIQYQLVREERSDFELECRADDVCPLAREDNDSGRQNPFLITCILNDYEEIDARIIKELTGFWPEDDLREQVVDTIHASPVGRFVAGVALSQTLRGIMNREILVEGVGASKNVFTVFTGREEDEINVKKGKGSLGQALRGATFQRQMELCTNVREELHDLL